MNKIKKIITSGKRKRAIARAILTEGSGKIEINKKNYKNLQSLDRLKIEEPIRIAEKILGKIKFDVSVRAKGGGEKGQVEASRLALSKAIINFSKSKELEKAFLDYLYVHPYLKTENDFEGMRINVDEFRSQINLEKFQKYLDAFNNKQLSKRVRIFLTTVRNANA